MKIKIWIFFVSAMYLLPLLTYAQVADGGEAGAFLKYGFGAKAASMGQSVFALSNDANAVYYNPAGLGQITQKQFVFMYAKPFALVRGMNYFSFAAGVPTSHGTIGLGVARLGVNDIPVVNDASGPTGETISDQELAILVGFGYALDQSLLFGVNFKIINQSLAKYSTTGFGMDLGMIYKVTANVGFGIFVQDLLGASLQLNKESNQIPIKLHFASYVKLLNRFSLTGDLNKVSGQNLAFSLGMEYALLPNKMFLRQGYLFKTHEYTVGIGFVLKQIGIDYALGLHPYLGETHRLGVQFSLK